jgi:hypothetical protein
MEIKRKNCEYGKNKDNNKCRRANENKKGLYISTVIIVGTISRFNNS